MVIDAVIVGDEVSIARRIDGESLHLVEDIALGRLEIDSGAAPTEIDQAASRVLRMLGSPSRPSGDSGESPLRPLVGLGYRSENFD